MVMNMNMDMNELLVVDRIEKYYGSKDNIVPALNGVSFRVAAGEFICVMGASGSGKTTLLNCISTIDFVSAGHIYLAGKDVTGLTGEEVSLFRRENLGFVFQDLNLLDTLTIHENIALALTINHVDENRIDDTVRAIAERLGIADILSRFPYEVSGGQKQRCACARAIVNNPRLIVADEPTGALDSRSAQMLLETMASMNRELNATILMVTHDAFSASYAKRLLFLKDGRIFNELYRGEKDRRRFFGEILDVMSLLGGGFSDVC
jgi:putative ABC transport system ATP-binding protein